MADFSGGLDLGNMGVPAQGQSVQQPNALGMLSGLAQLRNLQNQNALFAQTFAAKQAMGHVFQSSIDPATGEIDYNKALSTAASDPNAAFMVPEMANQIAQRELTKAQLGGALQTQGGDFLKNLGSTIAASASNPSQLGPMMQAHINTLSPEMKAKMSPGIAGIVTALTHDLPSDPQAAMAEYRNRALPYIMQGPAEMQAGLLGKSTTMDTGAGIQPGLEIPAYLGGGFAPSGPSIGKSLPPTLATGPYGTNGAQKPVIVGGAGTGNALGVPPIPPLQSGAATGPVAPDANLPATLDAMRAAKGAKPDTSPMPEGPSQTQSAYNEGRGKDVAGYEKELDNAVVGNQVGRKNAQEVIDAAHQAQVGGGAETFMKLGQALQSIGVNNDTVDKWANGSQAASQVIDKISLGNAMTSLRQQLPPGSRANMQEFVAYLNKNPNLTTDPRAMVQIFNYWNSIYDRDLTEQKSLDQYKAGGGDISRWPATWAQSDFMKSWAPSTPFSAEGVKGIGATPSGNPLAKTNPKNWVIQDGKLVPAQ